MHKNNIAGNASANKHPKFAQLTLDFTLSEPEFTEFIGFTEFLD
jgi:hypothetical protein